MGRGTVPEVRDGLGDCLGGPGRVRRSSGMFGTGREVFPGFGTAWSGDTPGQPGGSPDSTRISGIVPRP